MNRTLSIKTGLLTWVTILLLSFPVHSIAQQSLVKINGWNAYVHLPDDYNTTGTQTYPLIVFFPGTGEVGSDASRLIIYGPNHFIASGWSGNVVVGGTTIKPIIISLQPPAVYPQVPAVDLQIETLKTMYRVDTKRISLTGLSMGGWTAEMYVQAHPDKIASVVAIQAVKPDDNPAYPAPFATYANTCGHWLGYEQINDARDMRTIYNTMTAAKPGSATYFQTNVGGGGHCCWNTWYDPTHTDSYSLNGTSGNWSIYQYLLTFSQCTAGNVAPTVNAGTGQTITLPANSVNLSGTATGNSGATITSVSWTQTSGGAATITTPGNLSTSVTGLVAGTYTFKLTATDNHGLSSSSVITVIVNPAVTIPPTVSAGTAQTITLPISTVTLTGTATANGGATITSTSWILSSGGAAIIATPGILTTVITGLLAGNYTFKLSATDNNGQTSTSNVTVTVNAAIIPSVPPTVSAGSGQTITLPVNSVSLTGTATGNGGSTISSTTWTKLSGGAATITSPSNLNTTITGLVAGTYTFQLSATDNKGLTTNSTISVTVNAAPPPPTGCGCDITIAPSPTDGSAYLDGNVLGVKPGYKVCLKAGHYVDINLTNFIGTAAKPITIINCGGLVTVSGYPSYGFGLHRAQYVRVTGSGDPGYKYGILIDGSVANTSVGFSENDQSTNVEVDHLEVSKAGLGIACAPTPNCDPTTWSTNWKMYNMSFHDNYVHDTFFEGFYIGNTQDDYTYNCSGTNITVHPQQIDSVKFYNNIIDKSGWTSAQISQVVGGVDIHDNVITNFGYLNKSQHQAGLIVGGNSHGDVYRNKIISGTGNAFECFAAGLTRVYNNIFAYAGYDGTAQGQNAVVIDDRPRPAGLPPLQIYFVNNSVISAKRVGITFYNDYGTVGTGNIIANNLITEPGYYSTYPAYAFMFFQAGLSVTIANNLSIPTNAAAKFIDVPSYNFHLQSGSPAIDAGANESGIGLTSDFDNIPRPFGAGYDVGAFEFNSGNQPPVAKTNASQTITLPGNSASLDGSKSFDPDGTIAGYSWTQSSGPSAITISNNTTAIASVASLIQGTYVFKLTVTDDKGATGTALDTIVVALPVNKSPIANAGADITITLPVNSVNLDGSLSKDTDGSISGYSWSQLSGPAAAAIANASGVSTAVNNLAAGVYLFQLKVTDNLGAIALDTVKVIVNAAAINQPPVSNAGADITITLPVSTANLVGTASNDPDGSIANYAWSQISGPGTATIATPAGSSSAISGLIKGVYIFTLKVTDNKGATDLDSVTITVNPALNLPPIANAGLSKTVTLPTNSTNLDGSASTDPDGTIASYSWAQISGPSSAVLTGANTAAPTASGLNVGQYVFELTVTDNLGLTSKASVKITVSAAGAQPPIANAGADQTITLPTNSTVISGSGSTASAGSITNYAWTEKSGPTSVAVTNTVQNTLSNLNAGVYIFMLTVTDNNGQTATDSVIITVNPAANQAPIADAGASVSLILPMDSTMLNGSKSYDPDGTISTYKWSIISGPAIPVMNGTSSPILNVNGLVAGKYTFQLTVTDNKGASNFTQVNIIVTKAANIPPVANAGSNQSITAPASSVSLNGSASTDADGTIVSYNWMVVSGPGTVTINNSNTATPTVTGLRPGGYVFELTVTDNSGATSKDQVSVTVLPQSVLPNQAPIANAGSNLTITLPVISAGLNGTNSFDPDGTITAYSWKQISGPTTAVITGITTSTPTVNQLTTGIYVFELTVTDNNGTTNKDDVTITVNPAVGKVNIPPVAIAGADDTLRAQTSTYTLNATSSYDPDGSIVTYQWKELSGPNTVAGSDMNSAQAPIGDLLPGIYVFQVTVTDNSGLSSTASVKLTVESGEPALSDQLVLFPNPAHDEMQGKITSTVNGVVKINIYDMNGRLVLVTEAEKTDNIVLKTLHVSTLASGTYVMQVNIANKKTMVAKFVKN